MAQNNPADAVDPECLREFGNECARFAFREAFQLILEEIVNSAICGGVDARLVAVALNVLAGVGNFARDLL